MALIGRLFVILFAFLAACLVAGMIVVGAVLFPEFSDLGAGPVDQGALNIVLGFGFIFISGFALLPAMIVVADHRSVLYQGRADLCGRRRPGRARLLSRPGPVRPRYAALRGHRPASSRDHDRRGHRRRAGLLDDRGPQCRRLARTAAPADVTAATAVALAVAAGIVKVRRRTPFSSPAASAKPRAMNRTGLFIALGAFACRRIAVRDLSRARSEAGRPVLRCDDQIVSAETQHARRDRARRRDVDRLGARGCPRSSRWW